jgi:hypothetical protein
VREGGEAGDTEVRQDGEEGGVHPAGAQGEGEGDAHREGGVPAAGLVKGEDLDGVLARLCLRSWQR